MTNKYKYFIANWKMFGEFSSLKIINSVNNFIKKIKTKNIRIIFCVPSTLLSHFSNKLKRSSIFIGAQNCHYQESYGAYTGSINSKMIKGVGAKYVIIGHSENRIEGEEDKVINKKIKSALKNNLSVIFCIGETLNQKKRKLTKKILSKQIKEGLKLIKNLKKIIIAYEPVWSIGTGVVPNQKELTSTLLFIRDSLEKKFRNKKLIKIIYGGSMNPLNVKKLNNIKHINGFLIGGSSQSGKKFIDIIKNCYM